MGALVLSVAIALVVSFVCSISEAALLSVTHAQAQALGEHRAGRILRAFKREIDVPIAAILILNTVANTIGAMIAAASYMEVFGEATLVGFTVAFTVAVLLVSEIVPKTLGAVHTARLIVPVVYVVRALTVIFAPLILITRQVVRVIRGKGAPVTSLEEIRLLAELGKSEGALAERTARMIEGAARLKELTAYEVMVPRTELAFLSGRKTIAKNLAILRSSGKSRFPYSREGVADRIDGIVMSRDLLLALQEREDIDTEAKAEVFLDSLAREADFVTESTPIEQLLHSFQEKRSHLVIVVDEYGGTEGIVTLEDVLEEIVGEIQDENDRVDPFIVRRADGTLLCRGRADVRRVFDLIDLDDDEIESVSLGGLMTERLGRLPVDGDTIRIGRHAFLVLRATNRSVERVLVSRVSEQD